MNTSQASHDCLSSTPVNESIDLVSLFDDSDFWDQGPPAYTDSQPVVISFRKKESENASSDTATLEWETLIQEYNCLMMDKDTIDRRRFNKTALVLLDKCIATAKSMGNFAQSLSKPTGSKCLDDSIDTFEEFREILLNAKELAIDDLTNRVVAFIDKGLSPALTADERKEELQKKTMSFLTELSPQLSIKAAAAVKSHIGRQFGSDLEDLLGEIKMPEMSLKNKTNMYTRMFENLMDDPRCVSFAASSLQLLGKLAPADVWFLTFFAFVTVKRSRGDNLLMLGCVGKLQKKTRHAIKEA